MPFGTRVATRTYLEMSSPSALRPARLDRPGLALARDDTHNPALWRMLYTEVGRDYRWFDRLPWTDAQASMYLEDPSVELWLLRADDEIAGYFELRRDDQAAVEIVYFGIMPGFTGRGLGGHLLTEAVDRAWAFGARRVWLHTCSFDHHAAIANYVARGFDIFKIEQYEVQG